MNIKAVLFDCDGTVIDTNNLVMNAWQKIAEMLEPGKKFKREEISRFFGQTLEDTTLILAKEMNIQHIDLKEASRNYWEYHKSHHNEIDGVFPGVLDILKELKGRGIKMGIVTSGENSNCAKELEECGVSEYFDIIVGSDDTDIHKPEPEPALICCRAFGVDPSEVIMVGDSKHDIACGNKAGCTTVYVGWSLCADGRTLEGVEKPDYIINSAEDFFEILGTVGDRHRVCHNW